MNNIKWNMEYGYYLVTDQDDITILGYVYPNGALVRANGTVEFYATQDSAYAAI